MSNMVILSVADGNWNEREKRQIKGWFIRRKCALLLFIAVSAALVVVGVAVHYLSPDTVGHCPQLPDKSTTTLHQPVTASQATMGPTHAQRPTNIRLPRHLFPVHYRLKLKPDFYGNDTASYHFHGEVDIHFRCLQDTTAIVLHANQLEIDNSTLLEWGSGGRNLAVKGLEKNDELQWVTFNLDERLANGREYVLRLRFSGPLKDDMKGIYWSSYVEGNVTKRLVTSQLEPTEARKVFPCFDEPDFKATFEVIIIRRHHMTSLSNTDIFNSTELDGNWVEDHFTRTPVPMSTYLLAFTVCTDFEYIENFTASGTRFRVYARRAAISNAKYALETGIKIHDFFEQYFNISFPFPKQDMLAVPDFAAGAMENWGLIIYRETALLYSSNSSASMANKIRVASVISHELAHQWFGNLVSPSWWNDLWLNEGFASYLEYVGMDHAEPTWNILDHFLTYDLHDVMSLDSLNASHPIYFEIHSTDDISSVFDSITYSKGASVIRMMQNFLGEETFRSGLMFYLSRHQYANANHSQLWEALSEKSRFNENALDDVSSKMDAWIKQTGYPVVTVRMSLNSSQNTTTLAVCQTRFLRDQNLKSHTQTQFIWPIPFTYVLSMKPNWTKPERRWIETNHVNIALDGLEWNVSDSWIIGNIGQFGYYRVNYNDDNWMRLVHQLNTDHSAIPVKNRAQILDDAFEIGRAGIIDQLIGMRLTEYLDGENEYLVWKAAISNIFYISTMLDRSPGYGHLEEYILKKLVPIYNRIGWEIRSNDSADTRLLRSEILQWTCFYGYQPCVAKATELYRELMNSGKSVAGDQRQIVYCNAIRDGGRLEWNFAFSQYESSQEADEKIRLIYSLSCSKTPWILSRYLNYTWEKLRKQDAPLAFSYIARNPVGRYLAWNFFRRQWKEIKERYAAGVSLLSRMITSATEAFNTDADLHQLKNFWEASSADMGVGTSSYEQAIEKTELNIRWMNENEAKISNWLQHQNHKN